MKLARASWRLLGGLWAAARGARLARRWPPAAAGPGRPAPENRLRSYFEAHTTGRGILKWLHYFDVYQRHLAKFEGREVHILEIGVYSGGSLQMWRDHFGPACRVYGVDIEPACKEYEDERTKIFIGDQADRDFWKRVKREVPRIDVVIDDGGHRPEQQMASLEELLAHLSPGGVYLCEDVHGAANRFAAYVHGLAHGLNAFEWPADSDDAASELAWEPTAFQAQIASIHLYPYLAVIEKNESHPGLLRAPQRGTDWQPFLG